MATTDTRGSASTRRPATSWIDDNEENLVVVSVDMPRDRVPDFDPWIFSSELAAIVPTHGDLDLSDLRTFLRGKDLGNGQTRGMMTYLITPPQTIDDLRARALRAYAGHAFVTNTRVMLLKSFLGH